MANATIRVQFGSPDGGAAAEGHLSAEIDSRPTGLNGGKTSFAPGETAYILVYKSSSVRVTETMCSAGSLTPSGSAAVTVEEELVFEDTDIASLGKPARSGLGTVTWYGRSLGSLTLQPDGVTVRAGSKGVGVAKVSFEALADVYALASPGSLNGESDFSILALIKGEVG